MTMIDAEFAQHIDALPRLLDELRNSPPLFSQDIKDLGGPGVYFFSDGVQCLYVGRTRNFRNRHRNHCHETSGENTAAFAFKLARIKTENVKPSYKTAGSRKHLMTDDVFRKAFEDAKAQIRNMDVRFVRVEDPVTQTLFEVYATIALKAKHSDFKTA